MNIRIHMIGNNVVDFPASTIEKAKAIHDSITHAMEINASVTIYEGTAFTIIPASSIIYVYFTD